MAYITENSHTQTVGGNKNFRVDFPFLARTDIKVQLNGVTQTVTNDYTIDKISGSTYVIFNTAPPTSPAATIRIFRDTDIDTIEATYAAGSSIRAGDLNNNNTQLLYAAQEFGTLKEDTSVSFTLGSKGDVTVNSSTDWSLNTNSVELANMANNSVDTNELVNNSVTMDKLNSGTLPSDIVVNADNIPANAITTSELANASVTRAIIETALQYAFNPVGTVIWYASTSIPTGYLMCDGSAVSRSTYASLFAVIGTTYGAGDGSNTFLIPDLRGEFIRGFDNGKGTDNGRSFASLQSDDQKSHTHTATVTTSSTSLTGTITKISESFNHGGGATGVFTKTGGIDVWGTPSGVDTSPAGGVSFDGTHTHTVTPTIQNTGGTETRPRNVALLACIKY